MASVKRQRIRRAHHTGTALKLPAHRLRRSRKRLRTANRHLISTVLVVVHGNDTAPRRSAWPRQDLADRAVLPMRILVGYGFIEHGFAKLSRGPDAFAG